MPGYILSKIKNKNGYPSIDIHRLLLLSCVTYVVAVILLLMLFLIYESAPIILKEGIYYFVGTEWNGTDKFGIFTFIAGTALLTITTMAIAFPLSFLTAIYLSEYAPGWFVKIIRPAIELLVGIPSVVYGIFGYIILEPIFCSSINPFIDQWMGFIPIFRSTHTGNGLSIILSATILSVMILPTIAVLSEEALRSVPREYRNASLALGATRFETLRRLIIPVALSGIMTAFILGMMRAMGETMAIVMLMGNFKKIPTSILDVGYAMTSKILNDIGENLMYPDNRSALLGIAAVLFLIEILFIGLTRIIGRIYDKNS